MPMQHSTVLLSLYASYSGKIQTEQLLLPPSTVAGVTRLEASVLFLCTCVCLHDRTQTAETTITELVTWTLRSITGSRPPINISSKGQKSRLELELGVAA